MAPRKSLKQWIWSPMPYFMNCFLVFLSQCPERRWVWLTVEKCPRLSSRISNGTRHLKGCGLPGHPSFLAERVSWRKHEQHHAERLTNPADYYDGVCRYRSHAFCIMASTQYANRGHHHFLSSLIFCMQTHSDRLYRPHSIHGVVVQTHNVRLTDIHTLPQLSVPPWCATVRLNTNTVWS